MLIIEVLPGLKSKKGDITAEFIHYDIGKDEKVYVDKYQGFEQYLKNRLKKEIKLKNALYGICKSPCLFWKYTTNKLLESGQNQSEFDLCLFIGDNVLYILYGYEMILWAKTRATSITLKCNDERWVLIWSKRMTYQAS